MASFPLTQLKWNGFFPEVHRVAARLVEDHPEYPAHGHEFVELMFVESGCCTHETALGVSRIAEGDVFLFRPGAWHSFAQTKNLALYNCCFDSLMLSKELSWMIEDSSLGRLLWGIPLSPEQHGSVAVKLNAKELDKCRPLLKELSELTSEAERGYRMETLGRLMLLLEIIAGSLPPVTAAKTVQINPAVCSVLKLIDTNPERDWTLGTLAAHTHMAPNYLVRLFTKTAGLPPMAYLRRRRLEMATRLLIYSDLLVGEVGNSVGWPDANYFARRFRSEFGVSPSSYRVRHRGGEEAKWQGADLL